MIRFSPLSIPVVILSLLPIAKPQQTREKTVGDRLNPTLEKARSEREKSAFKAKLNGYALNIAIGLQVVLGSLTTGLSVVTEGKQVGQVCHPPFQLVPWSINGSPPVVRRLL